MTFKFNFIYVAKILILSSLLYNCNAQNKEKNNPCKKSGVDNSIEKLIPYGVCIPEGYKVSWIRKDYDLNKDNKKDIVLRYEKHPTSDGDTLFYSFYFKEKDTIYIHKKTVNNISAPFVQNFSESYLKENPIANAISKEYPGSINLNFMNGQIEISHRVPDVYGKSYFFGYNKIKDNWYLEKIKYWIGELPSWMIKNMDLDEKLYERIYLNEDKVPMERIPLEKLNLKDSKRIASEEESEYLMDKYDINNWQKN